MSYEVQRYAAGEWTTLPDEVADEEPLQITLDGCPIAVLMRTRGADAELVAGFLITEGILESLEQVSRVDLEQKKNHALVFLKDDVVVDFARLQRNLYSASSCGICGKASIEAICQLVPSLDKVIQLAPEVIIAAPDRLRQAQGLFDQTGGIHAAGLFTVSGALLVAKEDVGRHNAVDKVIGWGLEHGVNMEEVFLQVSGRVSFEIMQKALMVKISTVSAISAPSSLAIDFAKDTGMQLFGFVRKGRFNRYH